MNRSRVPIVVIALLSIALLTAPAVTAQEASPAASPAAMTGVTIQPLGVLEVLPGLAVPVVRVELAPGAALAPHTSPGPSVVQVESGQVSFAIVTGVANRARLTVVAPTGTPVAATPGAMSPAAGTPVARGTPAAEAVAPFAVVEEALTIVGEETALNPGEGVAFGSDVVHTFRNTGDEPAVLLVVGEFPPAAPVFQFAAVEAGATPMP